MLEVPDNAEGLSWVISQESLQLLLLPGLQTASITAAAAGNQQALAYLRFIAQYSAAHHSMLKFTKLDRACSEASAIDPNDSSKVKHFEALLDKAPDAVRTAFRSRRNFTIKLARRAVYQGHLAALRWLRALCHRTYGDDAELLEIAARMGHLDILKFLRSGPRPAAWDYNTRPRRVAVAFSAVHHPHCLQWLLSQRDCPSLPDGLAEEAARVGGLASLQILSTKLPVALWDIGVSTCAAAHHDGLAMLQWLQAQAAAHGDTLPWDACTCTAAAKANNLSVLQWLRQQDPPCPWDSSTSAAAARAGNLGVLEWLMAEQPPCPWGKGCTMGASAGGHLSILQWLRSLRPPCPWSPSCITQAAAHGHCEVLKWLVAIDAPRPQDGDYGATKEAARNGHLAVLQLLSSHGYPLSGTLYYHAASGGHTHVLRWLHSRKVPAAAPAGCSMAIGPQSIPNLLFLGDIVAAKMDEVNHKRLVQARRTLCTFHGLLRWCRRAVSDPSKGMHKAFDSNVTHTSGQNLLVRLSMLPEELADRIAVAAGLQHDFFG